MRLLQLLGRRDGASEIPGVSSFAREVGTWSVLPRRMVLGVLIGLSVRERNPVSGLGHGREHPATG